MQIIKAKDYEELSRIAANRIAAYVTLIPDCVLGLATGSSPVGTYQRLQAIFQQGDLDFSRVSTVNLDEYEGLSADNAQSYRYYMNNTFFQQINIDITRTFLPNATAPAADKECARYDALIERLGGIDLQLLGLGHNGHIAFNEPAESFSNGTALVALTQSTINANTRFFASAAEVPQRAYTMGVGSIFKASSIIMVVSGKEKAEIVQKAFKGPITPQVPASILQLHDDFTLIADQDALSLLK